MTLGKKILTKHTFMINDGKEIHSQKVFHVHGGLTNMSSIDCQKKSDRAISGIQGKVESRIVCANAYTDELIADAREAGKKLAE